MDWSENPLHTQDWFDNQKESKESEGLGHIFAQEVLRDYSGSVSGVVIPQKYVTPCIDAHLVIPGMEVGKWVGSLDPADEGGDLHAAGARKNVVMKYAHQWAEGDTGDAARKTIEVLKSFSETMDVMYDSVGVGAGVKTEINRLNSLPNGHSDWHKKPPPGMRFVAWNAGSAVLNPDEPIIDPMPGEDASSISTNKEQYANLKAQAWWAMFTRCYKTTKAVEAVKAGQPCPYPVDELCSFDSATIPKAMLQQMTKEFSQPVRKKDIVSTKFTVDKKPPGTRSPNLADQAVMNYFPIPNDGYDWSAFD
jgi:hypothetical protein